MDSQTNESHNAYLNALEALKKLPNVRFYKICKGGTADCIIMGTSKQFTQRMCDNCHRYKTNSIASHLQRRVPKDEDIFNEINDV